MPAAAIVRLGRRGDVDAIGAVERDAGRRFAPVLPSIAADETVPVDQVLDAIGAERVLVAEIDGKVVGYAWWSELDGEGHLEQVSVVVAVEGRRVGRQLIESVASAARERGFEALTLTTFADIAWNAPLYQRYGFVALDEARHGPELAARRAEERRNGLDIAPRLAMRRPL